MLTVRRDVRCQALLVVALAACVLAPLARAQDANRSKQVLVLNSARQNEQFYVVSEREMPRLLTEGLGNDVDFYTEYFDVGRFPHPDYETVYLDFLRRKYKERRLDLLIVMGDPAADFVSRNRDVLFSGTPVVFYTLSPPPNPIANSTGLLNKLQFGPSIGLALALQPDLKHVYVVVGTDRPGPEPREPGESGIPRLRGPGRLHLSLGAGDEGSRSATQHVAPALGRVLRGRE